MPKGGIGRDSLLASRLSLKGCRWPLQFQHLNTLALKVSVLTIFSLSNDTEASQNYISELMASCIGRQEQQVSENVAI